MPSQRGATTIVYSLIAALVAGAVLWYREAPSTRDLDPQTFCPVDGKISEHVLVVVDQTDALTPQQEDDLSLEVKQLGNSLARFGQLSIIKIVKDEVELPRFVFSLCNPGRKGQVDKRFLTESQFEGAYREKFAKPLADVLDEFKLPAVEEQSPIMETVTDATKLPSFDEHIANRRLVVFSDLLQNTARFSQYHSPRVSFEDFEKKMDSDILPSLRGAEVDLFYLPRPEVRTLQGPQHRRFWVRYFRKGAAAAVKWCVVGNATRIQETIQCVPASNS